VVVGAEPEVEVEMVQVVAALAAYFLAQQMCLAEMLILLR
jgi:hypothetical protein